VPGTVHLLLVGRAPGLLAWWRRRLTAYPAVTVAGTAGSVDAPVRVRALRPSMLVLVDPGDIGEACATTERCRRAAEAPLPALLLLTPSSPWLHAALPEALGPARALDALTARTVDVVQAVRLLVTEEPARLVAGRLVLDPRERRLRGPAGEAILTPSEATLLAALLERSHEVVPAEEIARALWGTPVGDVHARAAIRTHLHTLRRKLAATGAGDAVRSVTGVGYRLRAEAIEVAR